MMNALFTYYNQVNWPWLSGSLSIGIEILKGGEIIKIETKGKKLRE